MKALRTILVIGGFVGILLFATLRSQQVECEVCMQIRGVVHCAKTTAPERDQALGGAISTVCGTHAGAMDVEMACRNSRPVSSRCRP